MAERSPNFPSISLPDAIDCARLIYQREGRAQMPRLSAVKPLGYSSLNGRSLGMLGALRAYDLIDGRGDDVSLSSVAIAILNAPIDSDERKAALRHAFEAPAAFGILRAKGEASPDTLRWHLIKSNFRDEAAEKLIKVYLESKELVTAEMGSYDLENRIDTQEPDSPTATSGFSLHGHATGRVGIAEERSEALPLTGSLVMGVQERVLQSGMLSKQASFRVLVTGPVGASEIEKLLQKLEMDKDILADSDDDIQGVIVDHDL